jgi:hypothetical protein
VPSKLAEKALSTTLDLTGSLSTILAPKFSDHSKTIRGIQSELLLRSSAFEQAWCSDLYVSLCAFHRVTVVELYIG